MFLRPRRWEICARKICSEPMPGSISSVSVHSARIIRHSGRSIWICVWRRRPICPIRCSTFSRTDGTRPLSTISKPRHRLISRPLSVTLFRWRIRFISVLGVSFSSARAVRGRRSTGSI
jgi:hypothetical protein